MKINYENIITDVCKVCAYKTAQYITVRDQKKIEHVKKLEKSLSRLKDKINKDLKSDDIQTRLTALIVGLIDKTYERVGNDESAENGHYGITGLKVKHLTFGDGKVTLQYVGKSGVKHKKQINNKPIVDALKNSIKNKDKDDYIFYKDGTKLNGVHVNKYLEPFKITAKDIRCFYANKIMRQILKRIRNEKGKLPTDKKEKNKLKDKEFKEALEETAKIIGHESATLKKHYLLPNFADDLYDGLYKIKE